MDCSRAKAVQDEPYALPVVRFWTPPLILQRQNKSTAVQFHKGAGLILSWKSAGLLSGRSWVETPAGPPTKVLKITGEIMLAVKRLSQFRWSRHWAVTLSRSPCLHHPRTSVIRGRKRTRDIARKELGTWAPMSWSIWLVPSSVWVGEVWSKHGLKWLLECAFTCWHPISPLWFLRNSAIGCKWGKLAPFISWGSRPISCVVLFLFTFLQVTQLYPIDFTILGRPMIHNLQSSSKVLGRLPFLPLLFLPPPAPGPMLIKTLMFVRQLFCYIPTLNRGDGGYLAKEKTLFFREENVLLLHEEN